jgi:chorismate mutase
MACRGIRGAITTDSNQAEAIIQAVSTLLEKITLANDLSVDDIAGVFFTCTSELDAAYPAVGARRMGWTHTPLMCMQEMNVTGSLPYCIRVFILWNTDLPPDRIHHIYLREARQLRPDLVEESEK